MHNINDASQIEVHRAEPLVPGPSRLESEMPVSDEIPAELIQARGEIVLLGIHKLINSTGNKEELPDQWKGSIIVQIYKKGNKTD
jgi:hypothetical protein